MWSFSEAGRKHVISFVNNMMSLVAVFSVFTLAVMRMKMQGWDSILVLFTLGFVVFVTMLCNIMEFIEAPSKSDPELQRVKKLSAAMYKDWYGFKSRLVRARFCIRRRKLRMLESIALGFLMVGVMLAVLVAATMNLQK